jgi:hypothetical protein
MSSNFHSNKVRVLPAGAKGNGVYAKGHIVNGEVVEFAPAIVLDRHEARVLLKTKLGSHAFDLGRNRVGVGLGYTSLYNHSKSSNAEFESSPQGIRIVAQRDIRPGEEITINYRWSKSHFLQEGIPLES